MADPAESNPATYADLEAVPPHLVAEIIDGDTHDASAAVAAAWRDGVQP